jgi:glycosyltransferase involved in cell wall biosynthesis
MTGAQAHDVSAVVCTKDAIASIESCLAALKQAGVGELIVVDASSTDGTAQVADRYATRVLQDEGTGLGAARNLGIASTSGRYILNVGADNVVSEDAIDLMVTTLERGQFAGVGAMTRVTGDDYLSASMNDWWRTRFRSGPAHVIGTPSLFRGDMLRAHPYDASRRSSDDSEICERWRRQFGASFAISDAIVYETGKNTWDEVRRRCELYGHSDYEVFASGCRDGWTLQRRLQSVMHPARKDLWEPLTRVGAARIPLRAPFFATFTALRYASWLGAAHKHRGRVSGAE